MLTLPVQINASGAAIRVAAGTSAVEAEKMALADAAIQRHLEDLAVRKVIVVPDRIVNIVAGPPR